MSPIIEDLSKQIGQGFEMIRAERIQNILERKSQQATILEMGEGAEKFLAGLHARLTPKQTTLFFELIARIQIGEIQRVRSYAEIGKRLGVTKQAVDARYTKLAEHHPSARSYIEAIRHPSKPDNFSEMSPSDRRKNGIDDSYNYDAK